jgi:hypothetical protein
MLAITIEHAVTKLMVRLGGADFTKARWVSVFIRRKSYSTFLLQNGDANIEQRERVRNPLFGVQSLMSPSLRDDFPELSEALPGITLQTA